MKAIKELKGILKTIEKTPVICCLLLCVQSCVMHVPGLKINVVNLTNNRLYIGGLYNCDSCEIKRDIEIYRTAKKDEPQNFILLNAKDSIELKDKLLTNKAKIYAINADSLDKYLNNANGDKVLSKSWIKIESANINMETKSCRIVVR